MKQIDLIHNLKRLGDIKPSNEFAAISKLIILTGNENKALSWDISLAQKLGHLKKLTPRTHISAVSREFILGSLPQRPVTLSNVLRKSFNYSMAVGVMAIFMALITGVGYLGYLSPIPSDIYIKNVTDASETIKDIDIHLREAEYFAAADSKTSLALQEASATNIIEHTSPALIERESQKTNFKNPLESGIDELLNQAIL